MGGGRLPHTSLTKHPTGLKPTSCLLCTCYWVLVQKSRHSTDQPALNSQSLTPDVVQSLGHVWLFAALWTAAQQAPMSFTVFQNWLRFMSTESVTLSNRLILCCPLLLWPSIAPKVPALLIRFSFSIGHSNEYPGLISFRMDWFDLLVAQGTLRSLFQHHNSKASVL